MENNSLETLSAPWNQAHALLHLHEKTIYSASYLAQFFSRRETTN